MLFKILVFLITLALLSYFTTAYILIYLSEVLSLLLLIVFSWQFASFVLRHLIFSYFGRIKPAGKAILITGCDTGFGYLLALKLNKLGFYVFAGCLNPDVSDLSKKAQQPDRIQVLKLNVTEPNNFAEAEVALRKTLLEYDLVLHAIMNNAGISLTNWIEWNRKDSCDDYQRLMNVNFFGVVRTCRMFLPLVRESQGRVVNLSSFSSRYSSPYMGAYCSSKHATVAFSDALAYEMKQFNVKVISVEPWFYKTNMIDFETVRKQIRNSWNSTPKDIQNAYGVSSLSNLIAITSYVLTSPMNVEPDLNDVINAMVDAVTSGHPEPVYRVMSWHRKLILRFHYDFLPFELRSMFVQFTCQLARFMSAEKADNLRDTNANTI